MHRLAERKRNTTFLLKNIMFNSEKQFIYLKYLGQEILYHSKYNVDIGHLGLSTDIIYPTATHHSCVGHIFTKFYCWQNIWKSVLVKAEHFFYYYFKTTQLRISTSNYSCVNYYMELWYRSTNPVISKPEVCTILLSYILPL